MLKQAADAMGSQEGSAALCRGAGLLTQRRRVAEIVAGRKPKEMACSASQAHFNGSVRIIRLGLHVNSINGPRNWNVPGTQGRRVSSTR